MKNFLLLMLILLLIVGCNFEKIDQPTHALPGEEIEIALTIYDDFVPEPNAHQGLLGVLLPDDWSFVAASYEFSGASGLMELSPEWSDSLQQCYPAAEFNPNMKWVGLVSDNGYSYNDPITIDIELTLRTGEAEGCFNLGYLATKATGDLICAGNASWAPLSYPHTIGIPDSSCNLSKFESRAADDWSALFYQTSGWTGSDAAYSIPLAGIEASEQSPDQRSLIVFGDTFIGEVDSSGRRTSAALINNSYAVLDTTVPLDDMITFYWETASDHQPQSVFIPSGATNDWYWPMDGIAIDDKIHLFGLRLKTSNTSGMFNFAITGVSLLSFELDSANHIINYAERETPFFYQNENDQSDIVLGQAVMPLTTESGNPNSDGYIYVYGPRSIGQTKELVAARVLRDQFEDFSQWRYWNGQQWRTDIARCAAITDQISQEFSVTPLKDGKYLLVFSLGSSVGVREGDSPVGPFDFYEIVWNCPEVMERPGIWIYNAKAHPHLSTQDELLIGYNVNTNNLGDHFIDAGIYRPRFIWLKKNEYYNALPQHLRDVNPDNFELFPCYPNPFNPQTTITYTLCESVHVEVTVLNIRGRIVKKLVNEYQPAGTHSIVWDGTDENNATVSSGVYICSMNIVGKRKTIKMLFIQ